MKKSTIKTVVRKNHHLHGTMACAFRAAIKQL